MRSWIDRVAIPLCVLLIAPTLLFAMAPLTAVPNVLRRSLKEIYDETRAKWLSSQLIGDWESASESVDETREKLSALVGPGTPLELECRRLQDDVEFVAALPIEQRELVGKAIHLGRAAKNHWDAGRVTEAAEAAEKARRLAEEVLPLGNYWRHQAASNSVRFAFLPSGQTLRATRKTEETRNAFVARFGPGHPSPADADCVAGGIEIVNENYAVAAKRIKPALAVLRKWRDPTYHALVYGRLKLAEAYCELGRFDDAANVCDETTDDLASVDVSPSSSQMLVIESLRGWIALGKGDLRQAETLLAPLERRIAQLKAPPQFAVKTLLKIGDLRAKQGDDMAAERLRTASKDLADRLRPNIPIVDDEPAK